MKNNYKIQNGCYNCKSCFIKSDWDEAESYYCNLDGSKRPLCGSVWMKEAFSQQTPRLSEKKRQKAYDAWYKWSEKRVVQAWGICDKWSTKENE